MPRGRYTTTLHVLNSVIVKLKNLTPVDPVYRGLTQKTLPKSFHIPDAELKYRGGVEFGFMSCSRDREEALRYARKHPKNMILLEMQVRCDLPRSHHISPHLTMPHHASPCLTISHHIPPSPSTTFAELVVFARHGTCRWG